MISAGPFTLTGPGPNPPGQVELDPPAGDVVGVQVINSGLYVLQAVTGGSGSFIPPGWCQTLMIQPGAAVIVTQSTAAGPETVTTVFANWLQPNDQPPPSGPYTQVPPTPTLLGEIPAAEVTSTITLYPSSLAWGVLVLTSNPDFTATSENGSSLSPVALQLPVHPWGNGMYYVPYVNAGGPTPQMVLEWNGRGDGFFYEADEPLAAPPGVTSLEGSGTGTTANLAVPGGSPFLTLGSTGGAAPTSVVGATTGISYPITAVSSELWSTFIPGWDKTVTVTWPSSVTWFSAWSNSPFEEAGASPAALTTVQSFLSGTFAPTGTPQNVPSCSVNLTAGTWLITAFVESGGSAGSYWWLTTTSAGPAAGGFTGGDAGPLSPGPGGFPPGSSKTYSLTVSGSTTVYMVAAGTSGSQLDGENLLGTPNATGIVALRTA